MGMFMTVSAAAALLAGQFIFAKLYQLRAGATARHSLIFTRLSAAVQLVFALVMTGFHFRFTVFSALMALGMSLMCIGYSLLGFRVILRCGVSIYTLFLMLGGSVLPALFGVAVLGESMSWMGILGVALLAASLVISGLDGRGGARLGWKDAALLAVIFLMNGGVSIITKIQQTQTLYPASDSYSYTVMVNIATILITSLALPMMNRAGGERIALSPAGALVTVAAGILNVSSYLLQLLCAATMAASLLYPALTGLSIAFTALAARLFFQEKLTPARGLGILLAAAAVALMAL